MDVVTENLTLALRAARSAAEMLRAKYATNPGVLSQKNKDIKTQADLNSQEIIRDQLAPSGISILAEEDEDKEVVEGLVWLVDPLDGTYNFVRGFPMACVSVALWNGMNPVLGVIVDICNGDEYVGKADGGLQVNGQDLKVSEIGDPGAASICTGFPSGRSYDAVSLGNFVEKVQCFKKVRMLGSAAMMLAHVAAGRCDLYEEEDIYLWDVAAGLALVKAAGGAYEIVAGSGSFQYHVKAGNRSLLAKLGVAI